jgi:mannose-1-phosphate guanylyltransferase
MVHSLKKLKAVILVGGYGTRLRPLTYTLPKPLVPFINKPILEHQIEALVNAGVKEIILALNYYSDLIIENARIYEKLYDISIIYSKEDDVLGTAGPLALAKKYLEGDFYVLNSDVICDYPLKDMMKYHMSHKKEATMLTTNVDDPSRYGIVVTHDKSNIVQSFIEKPKASHITSINAGIYIFNESILNRISLKECSLEREIFPQVVKESSLLTYELEGFWMDIGQIKDYLIGQKMYIEKYKESSLNINAQYNYVMGKNVKIGENVFIENSAIFDDVIIGDNVIIKDSIVGWNSEIEDGAKIINGSVLGYSVNVSKDCVLDNNLVKPFKTVEL